MKILTERRFKEEIYKAIEKERIRFDEYEKERNMNKRIDELYRRVSVLEMKLEPPEKTCGSVCVTECKHG